MNASRSRHILLRGLRCHLREWGQPGAPQLFLLHGWADVSATFQFLVDSLQNDWHVIAPDWRGFGLSERTGDAYWFADYLGDLDALLDQCCVGEKAVLVGHSMGGNIACLYGGVRPGRVAKLVVLDAFGLPDRPPEEAPGRYEKWLNQLAQPQLHRSYANAAEFAGRLRRENARLTEVQANFLAAHLCESDGAGGVRIAIDPAHRRVHPVLYRRREAEACWRRVRAPVLSVIQADSSYRQLLGVSDEVFDASGACFSDFRQIELADCGHNLHHDQPERLARIIEAFLLSD